MLVLSSFVALLLACPLSSATEKHKGSLLLALQNDPGNAFHSPDIDRTGNADADYVLAILEYSLP
ncbi:hypothetical protein SK128_003423, partial [Halocaridina rubra]